MTTTQEASGQVERRMLENIHTLMLRERISGRTLAARIGVHRASIARRLSGDTAWLYSEVRAITDLFHVTFDELEGTLPDYDEWRARRDSNPKPSDSESQPATSWPSLRLLAGSGRVARVPTRRHHLQAVS